MAATATGSARETRSKTGHSKPRTLPEIDVGTTTAPNKRKTTKKAGTTKANTSKPRVKKTTGGRVTKKAPAKKEGTATKKVKKAAAKTEDKVNGAVEKMEGAVEGKAGKKASGAAKMRSTKELKPKTTTTKAKKT